MSNPPPAWPGYAQAAAASGGFGPGVARIKPTPPVQQGALPASNAAPWARGQTPPGGDATSRGLGALSNAATSNATQHAVANVGHVPKARKPYTITKQRERWTDEEHERFLAALKLHGRAWRKIEEHVGTKSAVQIRSHAQKFFSKLMREAAKSGDASGGRERGRFRKRVRTRRERFSHPAGETEAKARASLSQKSPRGRRVARRTRRR